MSYRIHIFCFIKIHFLYLYHYIFYFTITYLTHSFIVSSSIICFPSFIFLFFSNSKYCSNNFSSRLSFSMSSLFIVLSGYFLNIICSTIFPIVSLTYFGSFPILISVFYRISIFIILFSNLFIFSSIFYNLLSILFTAFNISSIDISIFLDSMLFGFYNPFFHKFFPFFV